MNYSGIIKNDIANGPGVRVSLFVSGCRNHCPGCFQPETWDFDYGGPFTEETEKEMIERLLWFLTDTQREIFYLIKIEGYTETEVAGIIGTSIPNVCKHMKKALERIESEKPNIGNNYS